MMKAKYNYHTTQDNRLAFKIVHLTKFERFFIFLLFYKVNKKYEVDLLLSQITNKLTWKTKGDKKMNNNIIIINPGQ